MKNIKLIVSCLNENLEQKKTKYVIFQIFLKNQIFNKNLKIVHKMKKL